MKLYLVMKVNRWENVGVAIGNGSPSIGVLGTGIGFCPVFDSQDAAQTYVDEYGGSIVCVQPVEAGE